MSALDQAGNQQPAIWSITEDNENQDDRQVANLLALSHPSFSNNIIIFVIHVLQVDEFLSLPANGASEQSHYVERVDENFTEICASGLNRVLELSLVQVVAGGVVRGFNACGCTVLSLHVRTF